MIQITLKNKYVFYCVGNTWESLDYRVKYQINNFIETEDDLDDTEQEISIGVNEFLKLYVSISQNREGVAAKINNEIEDVLLPQLLIGANLTPLEFNDFKETQTLPNGYNTTNEYFQALVGILNIKQDNINICNNMILAGKNKVKTPHV